ncbi:hypothetical protein HY640_01195 [Candidatus Woesearchaeota archaeon]|nr:hypothetical protein [Candidatus Woesearchaeota archaeon]
MRVDLLFLVALLVVLAGCSGGSSDPGAGGDKFKSGTKGLGLAFMPGVPPDRFLGEGRFGVAVQVRNLGTSDIEQGQGTVFISGFDPGIITGMETSADVGRLSGRSSFTPEGELNVVEFEGVVSLQEGVDAYRPVLLATACYSYQTWAVPVVCVDSDSSSTGQEVCSSKDVSLSGGQGAPVAVTKVQLSPSSEKLRFVIDVSNVGGGAVFSEQAMERCSPYSEGLSFRDIDLVRLESVEVAGRDITGSCKPLTDGHIKLINGKRSIFCELGVEDLGERPAFNSPMNVRLKYGYRDSVQKKVELVRAP